MTRASKELGEAGESKEPPRRREKLELARCDEAEAAERLRSLCDLLERVKSAALRGALGKTAARLAERQRKLRARTLRLAPKTAGQNLKQLPRKLRKAVEGLIGREAAIQAGIRGLEAAVAEAEQAMAFSDPAGAEEMRRILEELRTDAAGEAEKALSMLKGNVLFSSAPVQEGLASILEGIAGKLSAGAGGAKAVEQIATTLKEFIKRQSAIVSQIQGRLAEKSDVCKRQRTSEDQRLLHSDVREQAAAIASLAREIPRFRSETAA
ncbi:unnamed protein product, partial [marine sediment metagenome]